MNPLLPLPTLSPLSLSLRLPALLVLPALLALPSGCAADRGPSRDLSLRHIVLYQNGIGYFERSGMMHEERLHLRLKQREVDDVLKTLVVVESGAAGSASKPSTATALLPKAPTRRATGADEESTWVDVALSPRPAREVTIAYAVPTAAWKAAYRIVLPEATSASGQALLQAWALIDNVSDEDWSGVKLSLATGAPLSFATDLRSARFVARPDGTGNMIEPTATGAVLAERSNNGDRDSDGIPDNTDKCPDDAGVDDHDGCPAVVRLESNNVRVLQQVHFGKDSDAILPESHPMLDEVVSVLKANPRIVVTVEGHGSTDEKDPWSVSASRAGAVRAYLTAHGVKTGTKGAAFGATRPIEGGSSEADRAKNRRVEFRIVEDAQPASGAVSSGGAARSVRATQLVRDAGSMVRYDIANPVSIPRQTSTMVTLLNEYVPGEEVLLFRPDPNVPGSDRYPMRAARLVNRTGFGLMPGPVAIFGGGTFVGEGIVGKLSAGETATIPFGIDNGTTVEQDRKDALRPVRLVSLARGVMTVEDASVVTTRYTITTGQQTPSRIFLRHARSAGYTPDALPPGSETTPDAYLIPIPLAPRKTSSVEVVEREARHGEMAILTSDGTKLGLYLQGSALAPAVQKQVREIIDLRVELGRIEERMDGLRSELVDAGQRSGELRESLRAIEKAPRAAALQRELLVHLTESVKQTEDLSAKLAKESIDASQARARLTERVRELHIEEPAH